MIRVDIDRKNSTDKFSAATLARGVYIFSEDAKYVDSCDNLGCMVDVPKVGWFIARKHKIGWLLYKVVKVIDPNIIDVIYVADSVAIARPEYISTEQYYPIQDTIESIEISKGNLEWTINCPRCNATNVSKVRPKKNVTFTCRVCTQQFRYYTERK